MAHFAATIPSTWTQDQTWDYLADFRSVVEWDPSMDEATLVSGDPGQVGATFELVTSPLGKRTTLTYTTVRAERPGLLVYRCETDAMVSTDTINVGTGGAGTTVTYDAQLELKGLRKAADPLVSLGLGREGSQARDGLEAKLA
jgi:hypothetical protein